MECLGLLNIANGNPGKYFNLTVIIFETYTHSYIRDYLHRYSIINQLNPICLITYCNNLLANR